MIFKNVLALSPHTDDIEVGAGGTIAKLVDSGSDVTVLIFSSPAPVLEKEWKTALRALGVEKYEVLGFKDRCFSYSRQEILDYLYKYEQENSVDLVFTPSTTDYHQDHQTVTTEAIRTFKNSTILGYVIPRNNLVLREDCYIALDEAHVNTKIKAQMCYDSQIRLRQDRFNEEYIRAKLLTKGPNIGVKYAEGFELIKLVLRSFG